MKKFLLMALAIQLFYIFIRVVHASIFRTMDKLAFSCAVLSAVVLIAALIDVRHLNK